MTDEGKITFFFFSIKTGFACISKPSLLETIILTYFVMQFK
jgi:hypothetical protein